MRSLSTEAQALAEQTLSQLGQLPASICDELIRLENCSLDELLRRLIPFAAGYASAPISNYAVGAVALAGPSPQTSSIFIGANLEYPNGPLALSVHAEQAAVLSAWLARAPQIHQLLINASPCGYCRQFLRELALHQHLELWFYQGPELRQSSLAELLPNAFGPEQLGVSAGLLSHPQKNLELEGDASKDPLVQAALAAARRSYAPYTGACAGVALETEDGALAIGLYAENAAYNPSLLALSGALSQLSLMRRGEPHTLSRVVLVEAPGRGSQRPLTEAALQHAAPSLRLEYFSTVKNT